MADQPQVPDDITQSQFFEQLLPMGFQAQSAEGGAPPSEFAIQFSAHRRDLAAWRGTRSSTTTTPCTSRPARRTRTCR